MLTSALALSPSVSLCVSLSTSHFSFSAIYLKACGFLYLVCVLDAALCFWVCFFSKLVVEKDNLLGGDVGIKSIRYVHVIYISVFSLWL